MAIGTVLAVLFSTVVQMVFGELFPKNLAIARPEPVARWLALSTTLYLKLFGWLITLFDAASNLLLRLLRIEPVHDVEHSATVRDLEHIVAESRDAGGDLPTELSTLLDRILDFPHPHRRARDDSPRPGGRGARRRTGRAGAGDDERGSHPLPPVVGTSTDDLHGVVHLHDLLELDRTDGTAGTVHRPAVIVPTTLPLPDVLARLTEAHEEMALVIDEYGGFAGVVTVEDIAEELVGEIADEHDPESDTAVIVRSGDGWTMRGDVHLDEAGRTLGHSLPDGDYETLAGLVIAEFGGGLPDIGDRVEIALNADPAELVSDARIPPHRTLVAEVRAVDKHVPSSLHVTVRTDPPEVNTDE